MTLDELKPGQKATISEINSEGPLGQRLMALGLLDIRVLDHIIVGRGSEYSFAEAGLI